MADTPFRDAPERPASPGLLSCWWGMIQAHNECAGLPPIHPDALVLHFNGSGASCMVFAKDITAACAIINANKKAPAPASAKPTVEAWLDNELIGAQSFFPDDYSKREGYIAALETLKSFLETPNG